MTVGLAQVAIVIGGSFVAGAANGLLTTIHQGALGAAVETLIVFVATVYGNAITPVFYFDVAMRSAGYDMQAALDAMPS